ncbi:MAG: metallopeptidase TldD-related protein [Firmicutes bacterium]|nr:metallopeptidase TldD-related protein [Bacillota bacterium]
MHLDVDRGLLEKERLLVAVDVVASYPVDAALSFYREERVVETDGFVKRQCIGFYALRLREQSRSYVYADVAPEKLGELCALHTLPQGAPVPDGLPIVLSPNAVGHIFHEWAHLLELDFLGHEAASRIEGSPVFDDCADLQVFEDPGTETVGFNAFSDDARIARRMPLVERGRIAGFIDSAAFPHRYFGCGYLGYNNSGHPVPRTTNLMVQARPTAYEVERALVVTGLDLELLTADPLHARIGLKSSEGVYVEHGMPVHRVTWTGGGETTVQRLVSSMMFLNPSHIRVPVVGGICVKNGIAVRSAQSAPAALLEACTARLPWKNLSA